MNLYDEFYIATNESLRAVTLGLPVIADDLVVAIGGSGDQAFALLEGGCHVKVVDISDLQIGFIRSRARALQDGNYKHFFEAGIMLADNQMLKDAKRRKAYLTADEGRLERIRTNLSNLEICDPLDAFGDVNGFYKGATRVYLSNAHIYARVRNHDDIALGRVLGKIDEGALVYISGSFIYRGHGIFKEDLEMGQVVVEPNLTKRAREEEEIDRSHWTPTVLRRVSQQSDCTIFEHLLL